MEKESFPSDEEVREIFFKVVASLSDFRKVPIATYRIQLNRQFRFLDAKSIVSYLHELGISDHYSSPYFKAQKGSLHGYDILDHNAFNPEIGTEEEYNEWMAELKRCGMGRFSILSPIT
jgi:(1->4)-alpha-D-glucan 1-alpha-D-glucosylmutase